MWYLRKGCYSAQGLTPGLEKQMSDSNPCYSGQKQIAKEKIILYEEQSLDPDNAAKATLKWLR